MRIVVDRSRWGRGSKGGYLVRSRDRKRCCLGFACNQTGVPIEAMIGEGMPYDLRDLFLDQLVKAGLLDLHPNLGVHNSAFAKRAAEINDSIALGRREREQRLMDLAKEFGHEFVFEGEYDG